MLILFLFPSWIQYVPRGGMHVYNPMPGQAQTRPLIAPGTYPTTGTLQQGMPSLGQQQQILTQPQLPPSFVPQPMNVHGQSTSGATAQTPYVSSGLPSSVDAAHVEQQVQPVAPVPASSLPANTPSLTPSPAPATTPRKVTIKDPTTGEDVTNVSTSSYFRSSCAFCWHSTCYL